MARTCLAEHLLLFVSRGVAYEFVKIKLPVEWRQELPLLFNEAMNNVAKHAVGCTEALLTVTLEKDMIEICLEDNGNGFDKGRAERTGGLQDMRERAAKIGGEFTLRACAQKGIKVCFRGKLPSWVV